MDPDGALEEAAMDLGATPVKTFFQITLPVIMPAIVAGWMLAFTLSLDDLVIASFTSGPGATTLPMRIYSQVRLGVTPEINAVCTILIGIVAIGVIVASIINKRREVQRQPPHEQRPATGVARDVVEIRRGGNARGRRGLDGERLLLEQPGGAREGLAASGRRDLAAPDHEPERVDAGKATLVHDLPGDSPRLDSKAIGVHPCEVSGRFGVPRLFVVLVCNDRVQKVGYLPVVADTVRVRPRLCGCCRRHRQTHEHEREAAQRHTL